MLRRALLSLPFLRPRGSTNCDWNVQHSVFDLPELSGHIFQRNGYPECPLDTYELWDFLTFFTGDKPGGPFDAPEGRVEGVNWGANKVAINLGGGDEADLGLKDHIDDQMEVWRIASSRGELDEAQDYLYWLGVDLKTWMMAVRKQARDDGDLRTQRVHFNFYNYEERPTYIGDVHLDVRLKAEVAEDLWRLILPLRDCLDRALLFLVVNCQVVRGKLRYDKGRARVPGIARGGVLFNSAGGGSVPLVPAGQCDLGREPDDANALEIRFAHGALATGPPRRRGIQNGKMVATAVFTGHHG